MTVCAQDIFITFSTVARQDNRVDPYSILYSNPGMIGASFQYN